jgi:Family of unknown function (DUF6011)
MICGNCKRDHATVLEVKNCYGTKNVDYQGVFGATAPQMKYIKILLAERQMTPLHGSVKLSKSEASEMITELRQIPASADPGIQSADGDPEGYGDAPGIMASEDILFSDGEDFTISRVRPNPRQPEKKSLEQTVFVTNPNAAEWGIPSGYYAIPSLSGTNDLDFYRVDRPTKGRWAGYTFVKMVVGGKSDMAVRGKQRLYDILCSIKKSPEQAALRYAQQLGRCSRCNTHLTDEVSRQYGMGPNCRSKVQAA